MLYKTHQYAQLIDNSLCIWSIYLPPLHMPGFLCYSWSSPTSNTTYQITNNTKTIIYTPPVTHRAALAPTGIGVFSAILMEAGRLIISLGCCSQLSHDLKASIDALSQNVNSLQYHINSLVADVLQQEQALNILTEKKEDIALCWKINAVIL